MTPHECQAMLDLLKELEITPAFAYRDGLITRQEYLDLLAYRQRIARRHY